MFTHYLHAHKHAHVYIRSTHISFHISFHTHRHIGHTHAQANTAVLCFSLPFHTLVCFPLRTHARPSPLSPPQGGSQQQQQQ